MSDFSELIESVFIEIVQERANQKNIKKSELAKKTWPEAPESSARNRWNLMRTPDPKTGKNRTVSISDAYRLAKALEVDLPYLLLLAQVRADEKLNNGNTSK